MGTPYKMKYTNGKKANPSSFPFKSSPGKMMGAPAPAPTEAPDEKMQQAMQQKVDQVVTKKVDEAVGGETNI